MTHTPCERKNPGRHQLLLLRLPANGLSLRCAAGCAAGWNPDGALAAVQSPCRLADRQSTASTCPGLTRQAAAAAAEPAAQSDRTKKSRRAHLPGARAQGSGATYSYDDATADAIAARNPGFIERSKIATVRRRPVSAHNTRAAEHYFVPRSSACAGLAPALAHRGGCSSADTAAITTQRTRESWVGWLFVSGACRRLWCSG